MIELVILKKQKNSTVLKAVMRLPVPLIKFMHNRNTDRGAKAVFLSQDTLRCGSNFRILLLEEQPGDALQIAGAIFDAWGTQVELVHVDRIGKAIKQLKQVEFDVILLDLIFPACQGIPVFRKVREYAGRTPLIVFSGLPMLPKDHHFLKEEAFDMLLKGGVGEESLIQALQSALDEKANESIPHPQAHPAAG